MPMPYNDDVMFDTAEPELVEIQVTLNGDRVYVNVDGKCRFRAYRPKTVVVLDDRNRYNSAKMRSKKK